MRGALLLFSPWLMLATSAGARADEITIYRCTDAKGQQSVRDSPCKRGQKQLTQTMQRPRDARPAVIGRVEPTPRRNTDPVRYIVQPAPRPLHVCTTPDGQEYLSESGEGEARWMPAWAVDHRLYPPVRTPRRPGDARDGGLPRYIAGAPVIDNPSRSLQRLPLGMAGGYWARDACVALSPTQSCAIFADRRHAIRRRYAQAMPSERRLLDAESATLDARLRQECE